jgi:hypothetical protein
VHKFNSSELQIKTSAPRGTSYARIVAQLRLDSERRKGPSLPEACGISFTLGAPTYRIDDGYSNDPLEV